MTREFWHGLHQYRVDLERSKPVKISVHTGGRRWRTIWRFPEPKTELVKGILSTSNTK